MKIQENIHLKNYSTFQIGGPAKYFAVIRTFAEAEDAFSFTKEKQLPFIVIGKGSNCLFSDEGYAGLVILNQIDFLQIEGESVYVGAGFSYSLLGSKTVRQNLSGLEFATGIPGSVGGAIYMNAGAGVSQTSEILEEVEYIGENGKKIRISRDQIKFGYRFSSFQQMRRSIILSGKYRLTRCEDAKQTHSELIRYRIKTQPYKQFSAGCIFRNPEGYSAGALIEKLGLKGYTIGGASVSDVHGNFIINKGNATAEDVSNLIRYIQRQVKNQTNIDLKTEVQMIF